MWQMLYWQNKQDLWKYALMSKNITLGKVCWKNKIWPNMHMKNAHQICWVLPAEPIIIHSTYKESAHVSSVDPISQPSLDMSSFLSM
jgi:hypothetical protein